jgi:UDP-glucuronate decarboxylase
MSVGDGRVVSNFIVQALKGEPITIYGDGKQSRSFCYVSDLIEAIYKTLILNDPLSSPINLGNPNEIRIIDIAKMILEITNSRSELINIPLPEDDPKQRCPNILLAKSLLNWEPKVQLQSGIEKTIEYFKKVI